MRASARSSISDRQISAVAAPPLRELDPERLADHLAALYRVARGLCASHEDAEDLVQETFARLLRRPRFLRSDHDRGYLVRALRNTHARRYHAAMRRPTTVPLLESYGEGQTSRASAFDAHELMAAISTAPKLYRDAVLAIDVFGLSYRQAARQLRIGEATIATRLHRGRREVSKALGERASASLWEHQG